MVPSLVRPGRGFRGVLNYLSEKPEAERIAGNMSGSTPRELAAEFGHVRNRRPGVEKPVFHVSFRPAPEDRALSKEEWVAIAHRVVHQLGYDNSPWVAYLHRDSREEHIHVVASRVDLDGQRVSDRYEAQRAQALARALERDYGLRVLGAAGREQRTPRSGSTRQAERLGKSLPHKELIRILRSAARDRPALSTFLVRLKDAGVEPHLHRTSAGTVRGISYRWNEHILRGSDLGRAFTWTGLQRDLGIVDQDAGSSPLVRKASPRMEVRDLLEALRRNDPQSRPPSLLPESFDVLVERMDRTFRRAGAADATLTEIGAFQESRLAMQRALGTPLPSEITRGNDALTYGLLRQVETSEISAYERAAVKRRIRELEDQYGFRSATTDEVINRALVSPPPELRHVRPQDRLAISFAEAETQIALELSRRNLTRLEADLRAAQRAHQKTPTAEAADRCWNSLERVLREEARYTRLLSRVERRPLSPEEKPLSDRESLRRAVVRDAMRKEPSVSSLSRLNGLLRMEGRVIRRVAAHLGEGIGSRGRASGVTLDDLSRSTRAARALFLRAARLYLRDASRYQSSLLSALLSYRHQMRKLERASPQRKRPARPIAPLSAYLRDPVYRHQPFTAATAWATVALRHGLSFPQVVRTLARAPAPLPFSVATELARAGLRFSQRLLRTWIRTADQDRGY